MKALVSIVVLKGCTQIMKTYASLVSQAVSIAQGLKTASHVTVLKLQTSMAFVSVINLENILSKAWGVQEPVASDASNALLVIVV